MLVLSRKVGQKIAIGEEIVLVINRIAGNRVSIGVQAPDHVRIVRGELTGGNEGSAERADDQFGSERISPGSKAAAAG